MQEFPTNFLPLRTVSVTACCRYITLLFIYKTFNSACCRRCSNIRFTKPTMQGLVEFHTAKGRTIDYMQFTKILFNPFALWDFGKLDAVVRGNARQCPRKLDTSFSTQVRVPFHQYYNTLVFLSDSK